MGAADDSIFNPRPTDLGNPEKTISHQFN